MKRNCQGDSGAALTLFVLMSVVTQGTKVNDHQCIQVGDRHICQVAKMPEDPTIYDIGSGFNRYAWHPAHKDTQHSIIAKDSKTSPRQGESANAGFFATIVGGATIRQRRAINYCMDLAKGWWPSRVMVEVIVNFSAVGGSRVLGSARTTSSWDIDGYIYQVALAEAITGQPLNGEGGDETGESQYDVAMTLNTEAPWYDGVDAKPPSMTYDLVTVCLHELVHGLFMSGGNLGIGRGADGISYIGYYANDALEGRFDAFMANSAGCNIRGYMNSPLQLGAVLTGNNLWFAAPTGERVARLYAPHPYVRGSSMYHLSEAAYGADNEEDDLMTPIISSGYSQHNIGPVARSILQVILDTSSSSALVCEIIEPPVADNTTIEGGGARTPDSPSGSGGDSGGTNDDEESGNGFFFTLGNKKISGWVLVGAGCGIFLSIFIITLTVRAVVTAAARRKAPPRRVQRGDRLQVAQGGNVGGMV